MSTQETLERVARTLEAQAVGRKPPARLFFFTDLRRAPDPVNVADRLPQGAAVVYRTFGAADAMGVAVALRQATENRGCLLLIGADERLAEAVGADGLHLPERMLNEAPAVRARRPEWSLTAAVHSEAAIVAANRLDLDAVVLSSVFPSASRSAAGALGLERTTHLVRLSTAPVIALGGVDAETAPLLIGSGVAGLAAVGAWLR